MAIEPNPWPSWPEWPSRARGRVGEWARGSLSRSGAISFFLSQSRVESIRSDTVLVIFHLTSTKLRRMTKISILRTVHDTYCSRSGSHAATVRVLVAMYGYSSYSLQACCRENCTSTTQYGYCTVIWWIFPLLFLCTFPIYLM